MALRIFRSTDTSAPILNGVAGSLVTVLNACLVDGYGDTSALGQTKPYSATNSAVYHMNAGSGMYLAVDDLVSATARIRGFSSMTSSGVSISNGFHPFPTDAQNNGGGYFYKSYTTTALARAQILISNGKIIYFIADANSDSYTNSKIFCFGDIFSYVTNEPNSCMLIHTGSGITNLFPVLTSNSILAEHYMARRFDGNSQSITAGKIPLNGAHLINGYCMGQGGYWLTYPDPIVGGMMLTPIGIIETGVSGLVLRGRLPGIQAPIHQLPMTTGDTITGAAGTSIAGRTFEAVRSARSDNGWSACILLETSDTWEDTNFK